MQTLFEQLSESYDQEVTRQERQLDLCRAQQRAIRAGDFEYIEAKAAEITALTRQAAAAETQRRTLLEQIALLFDLPATALTAQVVAALAPEPCADRLRAAHSRICSVQEELREVALTGVQSLQRTATAIIGAMEAFRGCVMLLPEPASHVQHEAGEGVARVVG